MISRRSVHAHSAAGEITAAQNTVTDRSARQRNWGASRGLPGAAMGETAGSAVEEVGDRAPPAPEAATDRRLAPPSTTDGIATALLAPAASSCSDADDRGPCVAPGTPEAPVGPPTLESMTERFLSLDFVSLGKALERFKFDPRLAVALRVPSQAAGPAATLQPAELPPPPPPLDFHRVYSSVDTLLAVHEQQALQVNAALGRLVAANKMSRVLPVSAVISARNWCRAFSLIPSVFLACYCCCLGIRLLAAVFRYTPRAVPRCCLWTVRSKVVSGCWLEWRPVSMPSVRTWVPLGRIRDT